MKKNRRQILTTKVYGFNPWLDQVSSINQIMEQTAQKSEAGLLRDLIDEALVARRRKARPLELPEQLPVQGSAEILETIQSLLLRIIGQGERTLRAQGVSFMLTQETLAQAHAGRKLVWDLFMKADLRQREISEEEIAKSFDEQSEEAREYAYSLAEEFTKGQTRREPQLENAGFDESG